MLASFVIERAGPRTHSAPLETGVVVAMRALILGGTRFIGRQIAMAVLEHGHELTLFHRGQTGTELQLLLAHKGR